MPLRTQRAHRPGFSLGTVAYTSSVTRRVQGQPGLPEILSQKQYFEPKWLLELGSPETFAEWLVQGSLGPETTQGLGKRSGRF